MTAVKMIFQERSRDLRESWLFAPKIFVQQIFQFLYCIKFKDSNKINKQTY